MKIIIFVELCFVKSRTNWKLLRPKSGIEIVLGKFIVDIIILGFGNFGFENYGNSLILGVSIDSRWCIYNIPLKQLSIFRNLV